MFKEDINTLEIEETIQRDLEKENFNIEFENFNKEENRPKINV